MANQTVMIGMSGGVDSSVAALLLTTTAMDCVGATMQLWDLPDCTDAMRIAQQLGIPHKTLDCRDAFRNTVIDPFVASYQQGFTPNPCILCNRTMKFGLMLDMAREMGYDYVATGHYAQIQQDLETGRFLLLRAEDVKKDQSYFLYAMSQEQLSRTFFPLGRLTKPQIREIAESRGLVTAHKHDSQDICFIPDGDYAAFIRRYTGKDFAAGDFLDENGKVLGQHKGAIAYTLGQRRGLGVALGEPAYVCGKDMARNTVTLGPNTSLFHKSLTAGNFNWIVLPQGDAPITCTAKIRNTQADQPATAYPGPDGTCRVVFEHAQRAIAPGQSVVLYRGNVVLGGGIILSADDNG